MSVGMLFPASSMRVTVLFVCNISIIALPPNKPTLFHLRSENIETKLEFIVNKKILVEGGKARNELQYTKQHTLKPGTCTCVSYVPSLNAMW